MIITFYQLFYDNGLHAKTETANQTLEGNANYKKPGLYVESVQHESNQNSSSEEVAKIVSIVNDLTTKGVYWNDCHKEKQELKSHHIKIIAPYNDRSNCCKRLCLIFTMALEL
jgi:hypothetical protein